MATIEELTEQITVLDDMIDSLVELLEEKGVITTEEWENKVKEKLNV